VVLLGALALHPWFRWILPGLAGLAATVAMQLTAGAGKARVSRTS
jgi:hypothetical protein